MNERELQARTKEFTVGTLKMVERMPSSSASQVVARQISRSAGSVGANYRAACRARSGPDFLHKLGIVEEEADETAFWLEIIEAMDWASPGEVRPLHAEAGELTAIMVASRKTAARNAQERPRTNQKAAPKETCD